MIAGPSEILVVCDGGTDPRWIAMDLFSQAEHDEDAQSILVSPDGAFLDRVAAAVEALLPDMERAEIIRRSLAARGALLEKIRNAGAVFMGRYTAEAVGDYCAGPNHVLPTSRTARFSSPLGVYDFQKRSSLIHCSPEGAARLGRYAAALARGEGLTAHARSAEYRVEDVDGQG